MFYTSNWSSESKEKVESIIKRGLIKYFNKNSKFPRKKVYLIKKDYLILNFKYNFRTKTFLTKVVDIKICTL